jgi:hypothetical protein
VSAGFVGLDDDCVPKCWGRSVSLDRDGLEDDADCVMQMIETEIDVACLREKT